MIALAGGCAPALPRELFLDATLAAPEAAQVRRAVDVANERLGQALGGEPVLALAGPYADPDGFSYADLDDGVHVVYPLDASSPEYRWIADTTGQEYGGYGTLGDVLLIARLPADASAAERDAYRQLALHELGHFLGMTHNPDPASIMNAGPWHAPLATYTDADLRAFCIIYGC